MGVGVRESFTPGCDGDAPTMQMRGRMTSRPIRPQGHGIWKAYYADNGSGGPAVLIDKNRKNKAIVGNQKVEWA